MTDPNPFYPCPWFYGPPHQETPMFDHQATPFRPMPSSDTHLTPVGVEFGRPCSQGEPPQPAIAEIADRTSIAADRVDRFRERLEMLHDRLFGSTPREAEPPSACDPGHTPEIVMAGAQAERLRQALNRAEDVAALLCGKL